MGSLWALSPVLLAADQRDAQWISSLVLPHKGADENLCVLMEQFQCFSHVGFPLGVLQCPVSHLKSLIPFELTFVYGVKE